MFLDMGRLKILLNILDVFFFTFWGFTTIEIIPLVAVHGLSFQSLNEVVAFLFSLTGLIFLSLKVWFFFANSRMTILHRKEDLKTKEIDNIQKIRERYLFQDELENLPVEEIEKSRKRMP